MKNIRIHPAAESFRLMTEEEFARLAASIQEHGLVDDIIIGRVNGADNEMLVDGRNRLRACESVGVEPRFHTIEFENDDAVKTFIETRSERRDLSKGERAMGLALLYPEPERGRGKKDQARKGAETASISYRRIQEARQVRKHSRELAEAVRDGTTKLDDALEIVKRARDLVQTDETQLARLRREAPDLAELVEEDRMKLREAMTVLAERIAELDRKRRTATDLLARFVYAWHPRNADPVEWAARMTADVTPKYWPDDGQIQLTKRNLELTAEVFAAIAAASNKWEA